MNPQLIATRVRPVLLSLLWLAAVASGLRVARDYAATPGGSGQAPSRWPEESLIPRAASGSTLVMLAHPRCPCTQASLDELAHIMARARGRLQAHVLFYQPVERPESWSETSLWRAAAAIPGVTPWRDTGSIEARRFSAETSGHAVLYDSGRRLRFSGGITGLRGHAGDNSGRRAVAALLKGEESSVSRTPVFGCPLAQPAAGGAG